MTFLGVIPARGGSKSIPRKNIALLAGKPLIAHTCEAALKSTRMANVVVSTDDPAIAQAARAAGITTILDRPAHLAADETPMVDVLKDALHQCDDQGIACDAVVLLQPTSPLRTAAHIDAAAELFMQTGAETVVSVVPVPHQFSPGSLMQADAEGHLSHLIPEQADILRRQDKPMLFARNGPAILIAKRAVIEAGALYGAHVRGYAMDARTSVDIDDAGDLAYAEYLLTRQGA